MLDGRLAELERRFGLRPEDGLQIVGTAALATRPWDPGWPLLIVPAAAPDHPAADGFAPSVLPGRHARPADPAELLRALYPEDHAVHALGGVSTTVGALTADALASDVHVVPPLVGEWNAASPHGLPWLAARLRAPDGCPWDREQDHRSLQKFLLEEAYEVHDALEAGSTPELAEELGDLLLQVVLHAHYAAEAGVFDLTDVYRSIVTKIVRRHPHVFGDEEARTAEQVMRNWERIKAGERAARGEPAAADVPATAGAAAFRGLSRSLPALLYAQEMQERAAGLGYDWPDVEGVIEKLAEEADELLAADDAEARREEFGDLLLVTVNLGRKLGLDAEASLRAASAKFGRRFAQVERMAAEDGRELREMTFDELDELWDRAKAREREAVTR